MIFSKNIFFAFLVALTIASGCTKANRFTEKDIIGQWKTKYYVPTSNLILTVGYKASNAINSTDEVLCDEVLYLERGFQMTQTISCSQIEQRFEFSGTWKFIKNDGENVVALYGAKNTFPEVPLGFLLGSKDFSEEGILVSPAIQDSFVLSDQPRLGYMYPRDGFVLLYVRNRNDQTILRAGKYHIDVNIEYKR